MSRVDHQIGAIKKGFSESRSNVKFSFVTQVIGRRVLQFISSYIVTWGVFTRHALN